MVYDESRVRDIPPADARRPQAGWIDPRYGRWRATAPRPAEWGQGYGGGYGREGDYGHGARHGDEQPGRWMGQEAGAAPSPPAGPFAGRGPKSYRRADERIMEDVCEMMTRHPALDASDIEVQVADGEVTLEGTVADRRAKRLAEDVAEGATGVRDVHNRLRLAPGG